MNIISSTVVSSLGTLRATFQRQALAASQADERYLADASDISDLEHRMRQLDERRAPIIANHYLAIYPAGSGR